jgi:hypothetical protein
MRAACRGAKHDRGTPHPLAMAACGSDQPPTGRECGPFGGTVGESMRYTVAGSAAIAAPACRYLGCRYLVDTDRTADKVPTCDATPCDGAGRRKTRYARERAGFWGSVRCHETVFWCPRQESNLYLSLRRTPFYPLNYEDEGACDFTSSVSRTSPCRSDRSRFVARPGRAASTGG